MPKTNYIIKEHPMELHKRTWVQCKPIFKDIAVTMIIIYLVMNAVPYILGYFVPKSYVDFMAYFMSMEEEVKKALPDAPIVLFIYAIFVNGPVKLGQALFALTVIRARQADSSAVAEGFTVFRKAATVFLLQVILISFWSMFFIIPGVIMALGLLMVYFVLADDPETPILYVLAKSRIMMRGNKMYFLSLLLYFLPVLGVCYIPGLLLDFTGIVSSTSLIGILCYIFADMPLYIATGYFTIVIGVMYETIKSGGLENFRYAGEEVFRAPIEEINRAISEK